MAQTYTRQSSMSDGDTITAALFNNEYNQLLNAFAYSSSSASSTGHRHDGTAAQGGNIHTIGDLDFLNKIVADSTNNRWGVFVEVSSAAVEQIRIQDGVIVPVTDNDIDLGTSSVEFKDAYFDGTVTTDALVADTADINGGTVDGATVGANSASSGAFTTITASSSITGSGTVQGTTITATTAFVPDASDGAALGTSALEFSDLFLADGAVINFGDDQDVSLTHVADTGLLISSTDQLQFGDSGTYIYQSADGVLDLVSDTEIEINATTIDINGNVDISGTLTVAGALDFGDAALSNVGDVQLDSIAGDGDTNTSITFSGSDVITITAGGDTQFTFNNGSILPTTDNDIDLGSSSYEFKDGYFDGTVYADAINFNGTAIAATAAELNIVDGDTSATSTTLADADRVVVNDGGTMKQVALTDFETYFESSIDTIANFEVTTELQTPLIAFTDGDDAIQIADGGGVTMAAGLTSTAAANTLGATSFNDADITNVGAVQLDSIAGDGDTNTSITFSGSDVITIATGGSGRLTIGDGALSPVTDNEIDLGTSSLEFKDAFFDGTVTADAFAGPLTGNVTGNASGTALTVTQAAQTAITSLGTLTALTVDDVAINGKVITMTGSTSDTAVFTAGTNGTLSIVTTDDAAAAANIQITADGTVDIDSAGVLTLDSGAAINIEPAAGSAILLDGTISIDAGVVTGATAITLSGELDAGSLDISGDADIDGTLETDALTINGSALNYKAFGTSSIMLGDNATGTIDAANYNTGLGVDVFAALTSGDNNVAVGFAALDANTTGSDNVAVGYNALTASTTATKNTAIGYSAGEAITTGDRNITIGYNSGKLIDEGIKNVAVGSYSLDANTTGDSNVAIGQSALGANTTADSNVAVGGAALAANTTGANNVAVGGNALTLNTTGASNTAVGTSALAANTTASNNTAMGYNALGAVTTGENNVVLGFRAGQAITTGGRNTCIGEGSGITGSPSGNLTTESNIMCLGDDNLGTLFCTQGTINTSDVRDKRNITDFSNGLDWINKMKPVTYQWDRRSWYVDEDATPEDILAVKTDGSLTKPKVEVGLIAQDVLEIEKEHGFGSNNDNSLLVNLTEDETRYGINYTNIVPMLINAVQELSAKVEELETKAHDKCKE